MIEVFIQAKSDLRGSIFSDVAETQGVTTVYQSSLWDIHVYESITLS